MINKLYAYADETATKQDENSGFRRFGYGLFISTTAITDKFIKDAISKVEFADPNSTIVDKGYFHATDDKYEDREIFLEYLNSGINGVFTSCFSYEPQKESSELKLKLFKQLLLNVMGSIYAYNAAGIDLYIENQQAINNNTVNEIFEELQAHISNPAFKYPAIKSNFSLSRVEVKSDCKKVEPGCQVVDYLLWVSQRNIINKNKGNKDENDNKDWSSLLNRRYVAELDKFGNSGFTGEIYHLGNYVKPNMTSESI